jgi:hypothetical protein
MELRYFAYDSQIKKEILHVKQKNFKLDNFYFHYLDIEKPEGTFDSLALPYTFKDTKMSLIHQLYKNGSLSKKQFSFVPIDQDVGYIYLGYLPKEILDKNNFKQIASCKVDSHYNTWGCNIERVYIDTNVYESNQYAYFNTVYWVFPQITITEIAEIISQIVRFFQYTTAISNGFRQIVPLYRSPVSTFWSIPASSTDTL